MRSRLLLIALLSLLLPLRATTVMSTRTLCPVCGQNFVSREFGSWFQFGEVNGDLSNSLFSASLKLETCPYCLHTSLAGDFEKIPRAQAVKIHGALLKRPLDLRPLPAEARAAVRAAPDGATTAVQFRLARLCARDPDSGVAMARIALAAYYRRGNIPGLAEEVVTLFRETAARALAEDVVAGRNTALLYLLGEMQRTTGQTKEAAETFARVEKLDGD